MIRTKVALLVTAIGFGSALGTAWGFFLAVVSTGSNGGGRLWCRSSREAGPASSQPPWTAR